MVDELNISYEEFPDEDTAKVLTVGRDNEALWQFRDEYAEFVRDILLGVYPIEAVYEKFFNYEYE